MNVLEVVQYVPDSGPFDMQREHHVGVADVAGLHAVWTRLTEYGETTGLSADWWATGARDIAPVSINEHGQPTPDGAQTKPFGVRLLAMHQVRTTVPLLRGEAQHRAAALTFVAGGLEIIETVNAMREQRVPIRERRAAFRTGLQSVTRRVIEAARVAS